MKPLAVAVALGLALAAAGCGQQTAPSATGTPSAPTSSAMTTAMSPSASPVPDGPRCGAVWVAGKRLPAGYRGCVRGGVWVKADSRPCEFGRDLTIYADQFYAVTGGRVMHPGKPLLEQKKYRMVQRACSG
jgi:hypothetical protein